MTGLPLLALLFGIALMFGSGLPAMCWRRPRARLASTLTFGLAALLVLAGGSLALLTAPSGPPTLAWDWTLPIGRFAIGVDALSLLFLIPVSLVPLLGLIYGHGYLEGHPGSHSRQPIERVRLFYGALAGSLALLLVARDSMLFIMAWEGMALSSFFLITTDTHDPETRRAGWIYLVATHVGTLALFAFFALLDSTQGSTGLAPLTSSELTTRHTPALLVLAFLAFGLKAGLMPMHVWLPPAHAAAPSHVSAMLSGVVTKMGIYGLVRTFAILPDPPLWAGVSLLVLGAGSALAAMSYALGQADLKRLLAYSTIENVGIITLGLGLAFCGKSLGRPELVALGLGGALLHALGHALFKPLLFLAAGGVVHALGTRLIDRMGGLLGAMPRTATAFALAAVAICALPPLPAFASELLIYLGAFSVLSPSEAPSALEAPAYLALVAAALAVTGGLAVAGFVRVFSTIFLGVPRQPLPPDLTESPRTMLAPLLVLGGLVVALGLAPWLVTPLLDTFIATTHPMEAPRALADLAPLHLLSLVGLALVGLCALLFALLDRRLRRASFRTAPTWDCGYAEPTPRMQYTASSLGASLTRARERRPELTGLHPHPSRFLREVPDLVLDRLILPLIRRSGRELARLRIVQMGRLQIYILYVLVALVALMGGLAL